MIDDVSISTVHVLISSRLVVSKQSRRELGRLFASSGQSAVIYGVISKTTPQPCCTVLQGRLPPRNVVPYKLPLASTMMLP